MNLESPAGPAAGTPCRNSGACPTPIYIYIYRERERNTQIPIIIYTLVYIHIYVYIYIYTIIHIIIYAPHWRRTDARRPRLAAPDEAMAYGGRALRTNRGSWNHAERRTNQGFSYAGGF